MNALLMSGHHRIAFIKHLLKNKRLAYTYLTVTCTLPSSPLTMFGWVMKPGRLNLNKLNKNRLQRILLLLNHLILVYLLFIVLMYILGLHLIRIRIRFFCVPFKFFSIITQSCVYHILSLWWLSTRSYVHT